MVSASSVLPWLSRPVPCVPTSQLQAPPMAQVLPAPRACAWSVMMATPWLTTTSPARVSDFVHYSYIIVHSVVYSRKYE